MLTVRALGVCRDLKLQEFARIIFIDSITNYTSLFEDYEPLKEKPSYELLDIPKTVCMLNILSLADCLYEKVEKLFPKLL